MQTRGQSRGAEKNVKSCSEGSVSVQRQWLPVATKQPWQNILLAIKTPPPPPPRVSQCVSSQPPPLNTAAAPLSPSAAPCGSCDHGPLLLRWSQVTAALWVDPTAAARLTSIFLPSKDGRRNISHWYECVWMATVCCRKSILIKKQNKTEPVTAQPGTVFIFSSFIIIIIEGLVISGSTVALIRQRGELLVSVLTLLTTQEHYLVHHTTNCRTWSHCLKSSYALTWLM